MQTKTYDPKQIIVIYGGFQLSGFQDGTFLNVDMNEDAFSLTVGADGEPVRSKSNNNSALMTLTLQQSSASNDVLSGFYNADRLSNSGQQPILIKDGSGTTLYSSDAAWVKKAAASEFGNEAGGREWQLESGDMQVFIGGHN